MPNSIFKKQLSPIKPGDPIDYKDVELLKKFITERGKILPRRMTGLTSKQQRDLTLAVKRATILALLTANVRSLCCLEVKPVILLGRILPLSVMNFFSSSTSL